jgi:phage shock protein A
MTLLSHSGPTTEIRYMRQSEFDKINAALDHAEFALDALRKKAEELEHKRATLKSPEDVLAMNFEAAEIMQQLQKISSAVHVGNPTPHLRLLSDTE